MLRIYDTDYNFLKLIDKCKDPCVTTELETGLKSLVFELPLTDENLSITAEENYVETSDYSYIIKEMDYSSNDYLQVYCDANIEDLKGNLVSVFNAFDINVEQALEKAIDKTEWKVNYQSNTKTVVQYALAQTNSYDLVKQIRDDYELEIFFNTKEKILDVYDYIGKNRGVYFSNELKLKMLTRQGQSYDFATVLYPIGKDGLTIGSINNGNNLLENFSYCNKYIPMYWIQPDIEHAEELKMAGEAYLASIAEPVVGYSLKLSAIGDDADIGDTIILVDKIKRTKTKQRIVKTKKYPFTPEKDTIELSNRIVNFADTFIKYSSQYDKEIKYIKENLKTLE